MFDDILYNLMCLIDDCLIIGGRIIQFFCLIGSGIWACRRQLFLVAIHVGAFFTLMAIGFIPWLLVCSVYLAAYLCYATGEPTPWLDRDGRFRW